MKNRWRNTVATFVFLTFVLASCSADVVDGAETEGLTLLQETETDLSAKNVDGDATAVITVHRNGLRNPETIRDIGIDSPYDSDLVVRNRYGFPFVSSGNHGLPSTIGNDALMPDRIFDQQEQIADLVLALDAVNQMRAQSGVGVRYRWELRSLYYLISRTLDGASDMIDGNVVLEPTPSVIPPELIDPSGPAVPSTPDVPSDSSTSTSDGDVGVVQQAYTAPYSHRIGIFYDPVYWGFGHHSAVFLEVFDYFGTFVGSVSTRNHGREATDPTMQSVGGTCPKTFTGRSNAMPPLQPYVTTDLYSMNDAGGCGTPYDAVPPTTGGHVCNDDSAAEYWNVKYNSASSWAICGDSTLNQYAPSCN